MLLLDNLFILFFVSSARIDVCVNNISNSVIFDAILIRYFIQRLVMNLSAVYYVQSIQWGDLRVYVVIVSLARGFLIVFTRLRCHILITW